ncbi:unnamed protein product [Prorocentrum cordatum]|uniref:Uncharacterized protein n=1 Tax=Prorocentrum cordatum TaxID=2364126 RepID=A0ABN9PA89_9DINO|nr:unnamed protein product [Polarella glacialis]
MLGPGKPQHHILNHGIGRLGHIKDRKDSGRSARHVAGARLRANIIRANIKANGTPGATMMTTKFVTITRAMLMRGHGSVGLPRNNRTTTVAIALVEELLPARTQSEQRCVIKKDGAKCPRVNLDVYF